MPVNSALCLLSACQVDLTARIREILVNYPGRSRNAEEMKHGEE
jgi:hypothetical protein